MGIKGYYRKDHPLHGTFTSWKMARARCNTPNATQYGMYGGRGIRVCERWSSFLNFIEDMGVRPPGLTLDRKDNDGNYEPSNCRWATRKEQQNNKRERKPKSCIICKGDAFRIEKNGKRRIVRTKGRCRKCHAYLLRTGVERPADESEFQKLKSEKLSKRHVRPVIQIDLKTNEVIKVWPSRKAAGEGVGVHPAAIGDAARGKLKTSAGFKWREAK